MRTFNELKEANRFYTKAIRDAEEIMSLTIKQDPQIVNFELNLEFNIDPELMLVIHAHSYRVCITKKIDGSYEEYISIGIDGTTTNKKLVNEYPLLKDYTKRLEKILSKYFVGDENASL